MHHVNAPIYAVAIRSCSDPIKMILTELLGCGISEKWDKGHHLVRGIFNHNDWSGEQSRIAPSGFVGSTPEPPLPSQLNNQPVTPHS